MRPVPHVFIAVLGALAIAAMLAGTVLAVAGYSSAGAFSIAAACVGVLGTLAAEGRVGWGEKIGADDEAPAGVEGERG